MITVQKINKKVSDLLIKQYSKITPSLSKNPQKKVFFGDNLNQSLYI